VQYLHSVEQPYTEAGCADGFEVFHTGLLVASCPGGVCLVDITRKNSVLARLNLGLRTSNVAFGGGYVWITGQERVWRMPYSNFKVEMPGAEERDRAPTIIFDEHGEL
jgi:hypothetical protein